MYLQYYFTHLNETLYCSCVDWLSAGRQWGETQNCSKLQSPNFLRGKVDFVHLSHANHLAYSWASRMLAMHVKGMSTYCTALVSSHTHTHTRAVASLSPGCCGNSSSTVWSLHVVWRLAQMLARTTCHPQRSWIHMPLEEQFVIASLAGGL